MKLKKKQASVAFAMATCVTMGVVSGGCTAEPVAIDKNEEYAREFVKQFGVFDTTHDWNAAAYCTATLAENAVAGASTVRVYTERPGTPGAMLAAEYPASTRTFGFDFDKNLKYAFVEMRDAEGNILSDGYFALDGGRLDIGGARPVSRAAETVDCPTTIEALIPDKNTVSVNITSFPDDVKAVWRNLLGESRYNEALAGSEVRAVEVFKTYTLANKQTQPGKQWSFDYVSTIVGNKGKFLENICNVTEYREELHPEKGVEYIMKEDGPIAISYFWGGTAYYNKLGYFYYKEGATLEEIMRAPRFIIIDDAKPQANIKRGDNPSIPGTVALSGGMELPTQLGFYERYIDGDEGCSWANQNTYVTGTKHNLVFFGWDNEFEIGTKGSYTFPAGTHVGFFVVKNLPGDDAPWKRSYSLPKLNWVMNYMTTHTDNCKAKDGSIPEEHRGTFSNEDFVTYRWYGYTVMGIEDGEDHDANDMMFYVYANIDETKVPTAAGEPVAEPQSWILAMEDLGATDDFDFNDLVVKVSHVSGNENLEVEPLAAGGTLKTRLYFGDSGEDIGYGNGYDHINCFFGEQDYKVMVNTSVFNHTSESKTIIVDKDFTMSSTVENGRMGGFHVKVAQNDVADGWSENVIDISPAADGSVPQMLCVPGTWRWPKERVKISDAYPEIKGWFQDKNTNTDWYLHPAKGLTIGKE